MTEQNRINKAMIINALKQLAKLTKRNYTVSSWEFSSKGTVYGLQRMNKDGTRDIILADNFTKREIYHHMMGFIKMFPELEGNR